MVSQPDDPYPYPSSLVRGTQSVVSARTSVSSSSNHNYYPHSHHPHYQGGQQQHRPHASSRSKRYNRSHAGSSSYYVPQNEFPVFSHSGDVEILVSAGGVENRYLLHRHTLVRCSGFFEASTSREWSKASVIGGAPPPMQALEHSRRPPSPASSRGMLDGGSTIGVGAGSEVTRLNGVESPTPRRRWRYELDPGTEGDDVPMLIQKEPDEGRNNGISAPPETQSLFGGDSGDRSDVLASTSSVRHKTGHAHTHSSNSFFRSMANLSLGSSRHDRDYSGNYNNGTTTATRSSSRRHHHQQTPQQPPPPRLSQADADLLRDYDNLFRIFYNYPPLLDSVQIADAYVQCKSLLTLADMYDALGVAGPRVDHHLLQFRGRLWKQVAKYPVSYLRLGYLARSKVIFQEALIHVVGQWPAGERSIRHQLPPVVLDVIEDKVDELEETVARVEARLFRLSLTNSRGERVAPTANNYLDWLAVSLFRQWLVENTSPPPPPPPASSRTAPAASASSSDRRLHHHHHHRSSSLSSSSRDAAAASSLTVSGVTMAEPGPRNSVSAPAPASLASLGRTYRMLWMGGGAVSSASSSSGGGAAHPYTYTYLGHDECKRFLKLTPDLYSRDNLRRFEKRVDELKAAAREVVRPLMGSGLELEVEFQAGGHEAITNGGGGGDGGAGMVSRRSILAGGPAGGRGDGGGGGGMAVGAGLTSYLTCVRVHDRDLPWDVDLD